MRPTYLQIIPLQCVWGYKQKTPQMWGYKQKTPKPYFNNYFLLLFNSSL